MCSPCASPARVAEAVRKLLRAPLHAASACGGSEEVVMGKLWVKDVCLKSRGPGTVTCSREGLHKACGADDLRRITPTPREEKKQNRYLHPLSGPFSRG